MANQEESEGSSQGEDVGPETMSYEESGNADELLYKEAWVTLPGHAGSSKRARIVKPLKNVQKSRGLLRLKFDTNEHLAPRIGYFTRGRQHFVTASSKLPVTFAAWPSDAATERDLPHKRTAAAAAAPSQLPVAPIPQRPAIVHDGKSTAEREHERAPGASPMTQKHDGSGGTAQPSKKRATLDPAAKLRALERILDDDAFTYEDHQRARAQLRELVFGDSAE